MTRKSFFDGHRHRLLNSSPENDLVEYPLPGCQLCVFEITNEQTFFFSCMTVSSLFNKTLAFKTDQLPLTQDNPESAGHQGHAAIMFLRPRQRGRDSGGLAEWPSYCPWPLAELSRRHMGH
jgi:hypothetical protein